MNKIINTDLIKNYMKENRLTKTEFCKLCGLSKSSLNKVLNGNLNIYISTLFKVSKAINVKFSEIFRLKNKK